MNPIYLRLIEIEGMNFRQFLALLGEFIDWSQLSRVAALIYYYSNIARRVLDAKKTKLKFIN